MDVNRMRKFPTLLGFLFLVFASGLQAQDDDENAVVGQTLSWPAVEGAEAYELTIRDAQDREVLHRSLEVPSFDLLLKPGIYHYQVKVSNVLDQIEAETPWTPLVVLRAEVPIPREIQPRTIYLENPTPPMAVSGTLIKTGATINLIERETGEVAVGKVVSHLSDEQVTVVFPDFTFTYGTYDLFVQNPGGLKHTLRKALEVKYEKPIDLHFALGYSPAIPVYDSWFTETWNKGFYPLGATSRIDVIFLKRAVDQFGLGLDADVWRQTGGLPSATIQSQYVSGGMSLVYAYLFSKQWRASARIGGGVVASWHALDYQGVPGVSWNSLDPYASTKLEVSYWFTKWAYIEGGVGLIHGFDNGYSAGLLKPEVLGGLAF